MRQNKDLSLVTLILDKSVKRIAGRSTRALSGTSRQSRGARDEKYAKNILYICLYSRRDSILFA